MENQLTILKESLEKKLQVLGEIQEYNKKQEKAFSGENVDMGSFDVAVEEKGALIEKLSRLDDGFETLYERLSQQLKDNREKYASEIKELQTLISQVTELSVSVQVQEKRNKQLVEQFFAREKATIGQNRKASKAAYDYYKKASNTSYVPPQFMDSKQ